MPKSLNTSRAIHQPEWLRDQIARRNVLHWQSSNRLDVWHDRAAYHFLADSADQDTYLMILDRAFAPGAHAIIGTFALDDPESCSGLPVARCDATLLSRRLGDGYRLIKYRSYKHITPWGSVQRFHFGLFQKV